jgi:gluconate 2-dehydrogenase gamma chain
LLSASAMAALAAPALSGTAAGATIAGALPWQPNAATPAAIVTEGGWRFFTADEVAAVDAIVARLIPADDLGPGAKEAGCTLFIDRQLAGPYGAHDGLYMEGPFPADPLPQQGLQSPVTPREQYRQGLAALAAHCKATYAGKGFAELGAEEQDKLLGGLESGAVKLSGVDGRGFFAAILGNTQEGFFADPIHGGNRDMAGWKLIGFPGARYDFRDVIAKPNQAYDLPPVGLQGRNAWSAKP